MRRPKAILEALAALRAQVMGLTPAQLSQARQSIERVMLGSRWPTWKPPSAWILRASGKARSGTVRPHQNRRMPGRLPARLAARSAFLSQRPLHGAGADSLHRLQKYGANEQELFLKVRRKMKEWDIQPPTPQTQDAFRRDMREIRENMLGGR